MVDSNLVNSAFDQVFGNDHTEAPEVTDDSNESEVGSDEISNEEIVAETPEVTNSEVEVSASKIVPNELEYSFTDSDGKRQSSKIDLNDKETLKKQLSLAQGARKWQAERDQAQKRIKEIEPEYADLKSSWSTLEKAWEDKGIPGLINLLTGKETGYSEFESKIISKAEMRKTASPLELEKMDLLEQLEAKSRAHDKVMKEISLREENAKKAQEVAELEQTQSLVNPAFESVRFAGKLKDPVTEDRIDRAIWTQALGELEALPEGTEITKDLVQKTFAEIAGAFNKVIASQTETKVNQVVAGKKADAQNKVAAAVKSGNSASSKEDEFRKQVANGSITKAFQSMFR